MATQRIPLAGSLMTRPAEGSTTKIQYDQRFENCWPEIVQNSVTGKPSLDLVKRPGFAPIGMSNYEVCRGATVSWTGFSTGTVPVFATIDASTTDLRITRASTSSLTTIGAVIPSIIENESVHLSETTISGVATLLVVASEAAPGVRMAWWIAEGGGSFTKISDLQFPSMQTPALVTTGNFAHMDGYAFIMTTNGQVWNSDLNSVINWSATSFIDAQSSPDGGVGVAKSKAYILGFGTTGIDVFYNAGNATGSPLARVSGAAISGIGAAKVTDGTTIFPIGDTVYFIGITKESGQYGVYSMVGAQLEKISRVTEDKLILAAFRAGNEYTIAGAITWHGLKHLVFIAPADAVYVPNLAYCIDTKVWWVLTTRVDSGVGSTIYNGSFGSVISVDAAGFAMGLGEANFYFSASDTSYVDPLGNVRMVVQTANLDQGTRKLKMYTSFEIIGDIRETAGTTSITWSDNDYSTFPANGRTVNMAATPPSRPRLTRLGSSRRRAWRIEDTVAAPFRAEAIELEYMVGST